MAQLYQAQAGLSDQQALREAKQGSAEASPLGFALFSYLQRSHW